MTVIAVAAMLAFSALPATSFAASAASLAPMIRNDAVSSLNWSGYAATGAPGSVTDVQGSWIVPTIQGTCPSTNQYSSHWVGIDGYSSSTVEQTGTDSDCQGGAPTYYAWFEFYPQPSFRISMAIHPGDVMSAQVSRSGSHFKVTITDTTTGASFSKTKVVSSAQASSAEWITEAPSSSGGILPLADFGTVQWGTDNTKIGSTNFATIAGVTGAIGSFGSSVHQITMVTSSGAVKASPSSLSSDGTSFTVTWVSSGP